MATTTVDEATDLLWRSYAKQITQKIAGGGDLGDSNAVFICPLTTQGIASGAHVATEVTNNMLFRAADSLLDPQSPVYVPGAGSYVRALQTYLRHVFLEKNPSNEALIRFASAEKEATRTTDIFYDSLAKAAERFKAMEGRAHASQQELITWSLRNMPAVVRNRDAMQSAEGTVMQIQAEINGPAAADLNQQQQALMNAYDGTPNMYNMPCTQADVNGVEALRNGQPIKVQNVFYRPAYSLQGFTGQVDDWIKMPATHVADTITFSIVSGRDTSWANSGFRKVEAGANVSAWCFLRSSASGSSTDSNTSLSLDSQHSSIDATVTFKGLKSFDLDAGPWDVPDFKNLYPNLAPSTPPNLVRDFVQPKKILLGYAPGMTVKFDANTFNQATSIISQAQSANASVSIFGFHVGGSASGSLNTSGSTSFDSIKIDKQSLTLTIPPVSSTFPVCVGVLGRRM
jgi:hypothetical protein